MHMYETAATVGAEREESSPSICRFAANCKPAGRLEVLNCFLNLSGQRIALPGLTTRRIWWLYFSKKSCSFLWLCRGGADGLVGLEVGFFQYFFLQRQIV